MGLFTYVNIDKTFLPDKYKHIIEWQSKDVVEPLLGRIKIIENGTMFYKIYEVEEQIDFHGDFTFYTSLHDLENDTYQWVEGTARFTYGRLDSIIIKDSLLPK